MAAQSPVTIESSPPHDTYRLPSITPENRPPSANVASITRSSPNLLSPSAFVRPRAQPLKSGSRKQQVPAGANTGFASATSILKDQSERENANEGTLCMGDDGCPRRDGMEHSKRTEKTKSVGKLARPKKKTAPKALPVTGSTECSEARSDSFSNSLGVHSANAAESPKPLPIDESTILSPAGDNIVHRRTSCNLSEHAFDAEAVSVEVIAPSKQAPARKKAATKRPSNKAANEKGTLLSKTTRRPKAKSEAIVLDSDEPDDLPLESTASHQIREGSANPVFNEVLEALNRSTDDAKCLSHAKSKFKDGPEKSAYFPEPARDVYSLPSSPPAAISAPTKDATAHENLCNDAPTTDTGAGSPTLHNDPAPRRRRSWTPVKESHSILESHGISGVQPMTDEEIGGMSFSRMLGNFSHLQSETPLTRRTASGEANTKRRRLELTETHQLRTKEPLDECQPEPQPQPAPKAARKAKAPKKAQTITALATAAYHLPSEAEPAQSVVSAFFAPRKEGLDTDAGSKKAAQSSETVKSKKPRKSRAQAVNSKGSGASTEVASTRKSKPKKKVKIDTRDYHSPLYSPAQAGKQIRSQEFLFGTSSQLAAEEPPEFIRDLQSAVQQSEVADAMSYGSQTCTQLDVSPLRADKSCTKVPTAPHGTCLSVEQAGRELWCVSARDQDGSKLPQEPKPRSHDGTCVESPHEGKTSNLSVTANVSDHDELAEHITHIPERAASPIPLPPSKNQGRLSQERETAVVPAFPGDLKPDIPEQVEHTAPIGNTNDDWVLLHSDDSTIVPHPALSEGGLPPTNASPKRAALTALDANVSVTSSNNFKTGISMQARHFSTFASKLSEADELRSEQPQESTTSTTPRGRGRPRKNPLVDPAAKTPPTRGRGRPRKNPLLDPAAKTTPTRGRGRPRKHPLVEGDSKTSPVRDRGRPQQEPVDDRVFPTSSKPPVGRFRRSTRSASPSRARSKGDGSKSPGSKSRNLPSREWTNIDDISESDSPSTPSPRRRRASASPVKVRPLEFAASASPSNNPKSARFRTLSIKATDPVWPAVQAKIYPKIADTIKAEPLSKDMKAPSWHEKILLYDPIVLEDLTAWLNSQGLRTQLEQLKPKVKKKGRKKKDAPLEVDEWEVVEDELKPWMVQKWCEDHSICCLWKEGLRGGVKARY